MGVQELLIVFAILLLFFGAKKLPGLAGSLGTSIKEFRKAAESANEDHETDHEAHGDDAVPTDTRPLDTRSTDTRPLDSRPLGSPRPAGGPAGETTQADHETER